LCKIKLIFYNKIIEVIHDTQRYTKMSKKVTFAEDSKKHDGVCLHHNAIVYYQIMCGAFSMKHFLDYKVSRKVKTYKDILHIANFNQESLKYCKDKLAYVINLLREKEIEIRQEQNQPVKEVSNVEKDCWESEMLDNIAAQKKVGHKVSVVRRGCRDFGMCVEVQHIKYLTSIYGLIKDAIEENETADFLKEWIEV